MSKRGSAVYLGGETPEREEARRRVEETKAELEGANQGLRGLRGRELWRIALFAFIILLLGVNRYRQTLD